MKKCKFCGQVVAPEAAVCASCGANAFTFVCDNCGNEFENGLHCPRCGVKVGQQEKICPRCGNHYYTNACSNCGYSTMGATPTPQPQSTPVYVAPMTQGYSAGYPVNAGKDKTVALLLCIFLGFLGAHKFYEGKIGMGVLYLFTYGLFFIGWIVDIFVIASRPS